MAEVGPDLDAELPKLNPYALELLHEQCGADLSELQGAVSAVLDAVEARPLQWNPHAGDNEIVATLKELCEQMGHQTGRTVAWPATTR